MTDRDSVHPQLASLREAELPEHLWARIDQARAHRFRRRWGVGGMALALALVAVFALGLQPPRQPAPAAVARVAPSVEPRSDGAQHARVRALDRELQAAYRRNASDAEIAQLWVTRRALLARPGDPPARPVRI